MIFSENFAYFLPFCWVGFAIVFWLLDRWRVPEARLWSLGYLLSAIAYLAPVVPAPIAVQAVSADVLFFIAFLYFGQALLVRFKAPRLWVPRLLLAAGGTLGTSYAVLVVQDPTLELMVSDIGCAALILVVLVVLMPRIRRPVDWLLCSLSLLVAIDNVLRTVLNAFSSQRPETLADFLESEYSVLMQMSGFVLGFVFALCALAAVVIDLVERYRDAAERDPLTHLLNRRGFERVVGTLKNGQGAVLVCDIDHFKQVNDSYGHGLGDRVLERMARLCSERLPAGSIVARFGGEEFVVYLPTLSLAEAGVMAHALRLALAGMSWASLGIDRQITASFGVSSATAAGLTDAIHRADSAMYAAKEAGRNQVMLASGQPFALPLVGTTGAGLPRAAGA